MKNIHVLPTDKPSRLHLWTDENGSKLALCDLEFSNTRNTQNIYITSDEELKMGDWVYSVRHFVGKFGFFENSYQNECKKIILTTDQYLIKDGVQAIDDEFLKWFVENQSCEQVEVVDDWNSPRIDAYEYKIIIPKEEPKQEILEEREPYWDLVDAKAEQNNTIDLDAYAKGVQDGAKWQQEIRYSEEEVIIILDSYNKYLKGITKENSVEEWFKQFLKPRKMKKNKITKEEPKIIECYFTPKKDTSSATICDNCGKEKFLHTIGSGIKLSTYLINQKEELNQELPIGADYMDEFVGCLDLRAAEERIF